MGKLGLRGLKFTRKSRKYSSYRGVVGSVPKNQIHRRFYTSIPHQKSQRIRPNLNIINGVRGEK